MSTIRVIGREDIQKVFTVTAALRAVESALRREIRRNGPRVAMVFHEFDPGHADLDIKSGDLESAGVYGMKVVSWYDSNAEKALPALFGTSLLFDLATGEPKALLNAGRHSAAHRRGGRRRRKIPCAQGRKNAHDRRLRRALPVSCRGSARGDPVPQYRVSHKPAPPRKGRRAARRCGSGNGRAAQGVRSCPVPPRSTPRADAASAVGESDIRFQPPPAPKAAGMLKSAWVKPRVRM